MKEERDKQDLPVMEEDDGMLNRFSRFCSRHRTAVLVAHLIVAAAFLPGIFRIQGDVLLEEMLPYDHPFLRIIIDFSEDFGTGGSWAGIVVKARQGDIFEHSILEKVVRISTEVAAWPETYRAMTFSIGSQSAQVAKPGGAGEIKVKPLMFPKVPDTPDEIAGLKESIFSDAKLRGLVGDAGRATVIQTEFKPEVTYPQAFGLLNGLAEQFSDEEITLEVLGFPVLMGWVYSLKGQIVLAMTVSLAMMVLIIWLIFRNLTGMLAPVAFGVFSTVMGLGFIGWTGLNFSPLLYVLAFLVGARIISHAVQITHRYMEEYCGCGNREEACYRTMRAMVIPNWAGVVTDAAGFSILILIKIALMQQVAIFMTFWILGVATCGVLTPILCSFIPMGEAAERHVREKEKMGLLDRLCTVAANASIGPGKVVVGGAAVLLLTFCVWKSTGLKVGDPTPGTSLLWPDHPFNRLVGYVNEHFGASSDDLVLFFKGEDKEAVYDPAVLRTFDAFDRHLRETLPDIYKSSDSWNSMLKLVNETYRDGDPVFNELPTRGEELFGLMGIAKQSIGIAVQRLYSDGDWTKSRIAVFFTDHTSDNLHRIHDAANGFFEDHPMRIESGDFYLAGGRVGMEIATNQMMAEQHATMELLVLSAIFVLCSLFFRSLVAGLMLTLPLFLANSIAFAYMAMSDIGLSINTLPVSAVGVGVGVDFAIYIYNRCIEEYPLHNDWHETIMLAMRTSGKAVVYTGLTMVLPILVWFVISDLKFQAQMGLFLAMILSVNVVLAITLHPLMLSVIKPKFITRRALSVAPVRTQGRILEDVPQ